MSQSTFQVADAQNLQLTTATINGINVEILAYGDNTGTHVVEFDINGNEIASIFDPSTTTFDRMLSLGDGRIELDYDNTLDASGTTQLEANVYDLRTAGLPSPVPAPRTITLPAPNSTTLSPARTRSTTSMTSSAGTR